jgi:hypothetical protein
VIAWSSSGYRAPRFGGQRRRPRRGVCLLLPVAPAVLPAIKTIAGRSVTRQPEESAPPPSTPPPSPHYSLLAVTLTTNDDGNDNDNDDDNDNNNNNSPACPDPLG